MMLGPILLALMSFLFTLCSACPPSNYTYAFTTNITTNSTNALAPRFYGVPNQRGDTVYVGPWPITAFDPTTGIQEASVYYCYVGAWAVGNMPSIFGEVFSKWEPATSQSALRFVPDPYCNGILECECSETNSRPDTLRIYKADQGASSSARVGYQYNPKRAFTQVLRINMDNYNFADPASRAKIIFEATHELGHVVGLGHEHQRPDRDNDIIFQCYNLDGYMEARAKVLWAIRYPDSAEMKIPECPRVEQIDACMTNVVCMDLEYAEHFFPHAAQYVHGDSYWEHLTWETKGDHADFRSIMIYSSYRASKFNTGFPGGAVLIGKDSNGGTFEIFEGDSVDPKDAHLSQGDIEAVMRLYPKTIVKISGSGGW
ncbi:hypothetical protein LTR15_007074 [Elasticomyces elasticus]|nr:hypothetical protein LTR15_007074 [Elasticomyces elasticus]